MMANSIQSLLKQASIELSSISDSAYLDAELLLAHCLDKNRTYLHTWPETNLNNTQLASFNSLIKKRLTDYPVAYLLGTKPFWTLDLMVTPDVLIPRPETELLVELALDKIKDIRNPKILDLGTGSGAIALALASERNDAKIIATDNSEVALQVAKKNAAKLKLDQQVSFIKSNWLDQVTDNNFDLIVSNPPYIDPEDIHLQGTIRHEPLQALIADDYGMLDIKKITQKSHSFLTTSGWLILEHGFDQAEKVSRLMEKGHYFETKNYLDLNNNWRVTLGCKH
ncbi:MAG: peptide chain release factor N(5)-glutamine methyltransferase [Cocleimonas sp.]